MMPSLLPMVHRSPIPIPLFLYPSRHSRFHLLQQGLILIMPRVLVLAESDGDGDTLSIVVIAE